MVACTEKFKIQTVIQREEIVANQPQDIAHTTTNHHAGDDITALMHNDVSRELPADSKQQLRSQSSEDAGHRRRRSVRE